MSEIDLGNSAISGECATLVFCMLHHFGVLVFTLGLNNNKVFFSQTRDFFGNHISLQVLDF